MSNQTSLGDTPSVTSLPGSGGGPSPSNSPGGIQLDLFGPAVSHASRSATPEAAGENPTSDTSGLSSSVSSRSANLQLSLENRLRQDLAVNGSPEYELTWKQWGMESGLPICALRASGHRISDSDSTGWHTPGATDWKGPAQNPDSQAGHNLSAQVTGWPTPNAEHQNDTSATPSEATLERFQEGEINRVRKTRAPTLTTAAQVTGWPTPKEQNSRGRSPKNDDLHSIATGWATPTGRDYKDSSSDGTVPENGLLGRQVWGWNSPRATDGSNGGPNQSGGALSNDAAGWPTPRASDTNGPGEHGDGGKDLRTTAGWATPQAIDAGKAREPRYKGDAPSEAGNTRDPNKAGSYRADLKDQVGQTQSGSPSETGSKGVLNPALPLWMMGYPIYWVQYAPQKRGRKRKV